MRPALPLAVLLSALAATADAGAPERCALEGRVVTPRGAPVGGVEVRYALRREPESGVGRRAGPLGLTSSEESAPQVTGAEGRFRFEGLAPGTYPVTARSERGFGLAMHHLAPGCSTETPEDPLQLELVPGAFAVSGSVAGEARREDVTVHVLATVRMVTSHYRASVAEDRSFTVSRLPVGADQLRVWADAPGWSSAPQDLGPNAGGRALSLTLRPVRRSPVVVSVVEAGGAPAPGALLRLDTSSGWTFGGTADARGLARFGDLPEENLTVTAMPALARTRGSVFADEHLRARWVGPLPESGELRLALPPMGGLAGRVTRADGLPLRRALPMRLKQDERTLVAHTDESGRFAWTLPAGDWEVYIPGVPRPVDAVRVKDGNTRADLEWQLPRPRGKKRRRR